MTCIEKVMADHPTLDTKGAIDYYCPNYYGIKHSDTFCIPGSTDCIACWNQEIIDEKEKENTNMTNTKKTKTQLIEELENAQANVAALKKQVENLDRYKQYEEAADEIKAMHSAFMNSGFTNEQAFDLIKMMTNLVANGALNNIRR